MSEHRNTDGTDGTGGGSAHTESHSEPLPAGQPSRRSAIAVALRPTSEPRCQVIGARIWTCPGSSSRPCGHVNRHRVNARSWKAECRRCGLIVVFGTVFYRVTNSGSRGRVPADLAIAANAGGEDEAAAALAGSAVAQLNRESGAPVTQSAPASSDAREEALIPEPAEPAALWGGVWRSGEVVNWQMPTAEEFTRDAKMYVQRETGALWLAIPVAYNQRYLARKADAQETDAQLFAEREFRELFAEV